MRRFALLMPWLLAVAWPGHSRAQTFCPNTNTNIRLLTVNAHCMGTLFDENNEDIYDMDLATRMERIADIINKEDPDVVAVQDAFHDPCRDALAYHLGVKPGAQYPNYVHTLGHWQANQDAGMMVFSKHPFEKFASPYKKNTAVTLSGQRGAVAFNESANYVAWHLFEGIHNELMGWDRRAAKMVAMVRIRPKGGCPVNVAFTHFQADGGDGDLDHALNMEKRQRELEGARRMITQTLGDSALRTEPVFLLGDLNIDGNQSPANVTTHGYKYKFTASNETVAVVTEDGEWNEAFDPDHNSDPADPFENLFFRCGLDGFAATADPTCLYDPVHNPRLFTDTWGFEMPRSDWGQTSSIIGQKSASDVAHLTDEGGERLDYILHNQPGDGGSYLCPQRVERVFFFDPNGPPQFYDPSTYASFQFGGTVPFTDDKVVSDHFFVVGDFLFRRTPRCSPLLASSWNPRGPTFGATKVTWGVSQDASYSQVLGSATTGNRRHYAWFVIDKKGTISIGTSQPTRIDFDVYHYSDLSTAISSYHGMTNTWDQGRFTGPIYNFPDPPYYVRFSLDPKAAGALPVAFQASFHEHRCSSADNDFCTLISNVEYPVQWPQGQHILPYQAPAPPAYPDAMYFVGAVDQASSGANPAVDFLIEVADETQIPVASKAKAFVHCGFDQALVDCGAAPCNTPAVAAGFTSWTPDSDLDGLKETTMSTGNEASGALAPSGPGSPKPVLLRIRRDCPPASCSQQEMRVTYRTGMYTLTPISLVVNDEEDSGANDDEIHLHIAVDEAGPGPSSCPMMFGYTYLERFDEHGDSNKSKAEFPGVWGIGPRTFLDSTVATVCESDGGDGSDNDFLGEAIYSAAQTPIPPDKTQAEHALTLNASPDAVYTYRLRVKSEQTSTPAESCP